METTAVDFSEFRDNLCHYLLQSEATVAVTHHGKEVGLFIPVRRKRTVTEHPDVKQTGFDESHNELQTQMKALGITEEDIIADFERLRGKRQSSQ